jgi:hypothetical protein
MKIPLWFEILFINPNSPKGLVIRAERMIKESDKPENKKYRENMRLYAKVLLELASKNWTAKENKQFIKIHLRGKGP